MLYTHRDRHILPYKLYISPLLLTFRFVYLLCCNRISYFPQSVGAFEQIFTILEKLTRGYKGARLTQK